MRRLEEGGNVLRFGCACGFMAVYTCDIAQGLLYFKWVQFIVCKLNLNRVVKKKQNNSNKKVPRIEMAWSKMGVVHISSFLGA